MKNINIINGRIIDSNLINQEFNNPQFQDALDGKIKLDEAANINIKKILIFVNPEIISSIDLNKIDNETKNVLKLRCEIFEEHNKNIFDSIENFYKFFNKNSLYEIIKKILTLNNQEFKLYKENFLIPNFINNKLKNELKDKSFVNEMIKKDFRLSEFIDDDYKYKDELITFMLENNIINENFINSNISKKLSNDKNFIIKYILITPAAYRCFDHHLLDEETINILINNWKPNKNYKNFCSDFRFYRRLDIDLENSNIYKVISKYIPLIRQGQDYIGLCPFHDDHNPSLRVSPRKNVWTCFSCGAHGNVSSFVKKYTGEYSKNNIKNNTSYKIIQKNQFLYYLFANLPDELKYNKNIIKTFLEKDGCILKLVPKELKYDSELVDVAMSNDVTAFRYFKNNEELKNKYLSMYSILNYYLPKDKKD